MSTPIPYNPSFRLPLPSNAELTRSALVLPSFCSYLMADIVGVTEGDITQIYEAISSVRDSPALLGFGLAKPAMSIADL